jgi:predicted nuclease of restriction endonuclease-like (RecB) superfamily
MVVRYDNQHIARLNTDFANVLDIIQGYRSRAVQTINHASVMTAWHVGAYVSNKIKSAQWGAKVVQQLAEYIHTQDPTLKGWSRRTIYKMVQFYDVYSSEQFIARATTLKLLPASQEIVPIASAQIDATEFVPFQSAQLQFLTKTTWSNHCSIFQRCTTIDQYIFYILYAEYEHLQNKELERAIKADTYSRMLNDKKWQSEMLKTTYPQTQLLLKDKAILEFLGLPKQYKESRLRKGLVEHMREFIVELGKDFLFVGEEHALEVGGKTYRCDLLFFHRALQCLVAIELKTTEFDPRDLGQLEFYLEALDQTERRSNENPSIGILMCKDANSEVVRYALNRSMSPTMVAMYEEHLKVGSVLQRSLEEFTDFLSKETSK